MMGLSEIRDLMSSLFIMLNKDKFILFRIEFLVVFVTLLFLAMFIIDIFRRYIHSSIMKAISSICDAVSDSIVLYLLGAMKTAHFKNQLFPVWGLVLIIFRHNIDFISGYGVRDRRGRRFTELTNVIKLLGSAFLNGAGGSRFRLPLWTLWALQFLRSAYRFGSHTWASRSNWHGRSSQLVSEHMRAYPSKLKPKDYNPWTMKGYRYLVYGERVKLHMPQYVLRIDPSSNSMKIKNSKRKAKATVQKKSANSNTNKSTLLVTLDKIWRCKGHLLNAHPDQDRSEDSNQLRDLENKTQGKEQKDLSMAFALSRLLRCRLEDVMLPKDMYVINRELVRAQIIEEQDAKRAFRIFELQLAYVNDYFNTRYPMVFWYGIPSLNFSLLQSVVTIGVVIWLYVEICRVYKPSKGELTLLVKGFNIDKFITLLFMVFMIFKEIWEMVAYLLSDWTKLLHVCRYSNYWKCGDFIARRIERTVLCHFKYKITAKRWHGLLDQYVFMEAYDDQPRVWNWFHTVTTGLVPRKEEGAKLGDAIGVPDCVRSYILKKLRDILKQTVPEKPIANAKGNSDEHTDGLSLPRDIMILSSETNKRYRWAYSEMQTSSQVILVWHIATSFCEMELAKKHGVELSNPGFLGSIVSCFTNCCSSKRYLINVGDEKGEGKADGNHSSNSCFTCSILSSFRNIFLSKSTEKKLSDERIKERYIVANSLSRYCTYLLVSNPDLIPDSFLVPQMVFQESVKTARGILSSCGSLEDRYKRLDSVANKAAEDQEAVIMGEEVVKQGAVLGKQLLLDEGEIGCWEILADVWTELIIHIAPTWNAEAHKKCLKSGGEFITIIWALLWHCGIEKSKLWPENDITDENDAATGPQESSSGNINMNNDSTRTDTRNQTTTGTDTRNHQTTSGTDTTRNHQTRSSVPEIEEVNDQDHTVEDPDIEQGLVRRTRTRNRKSNQG